MENTEEAPLWEPSRTAIDSASQNLVTVRQVFPDGPAPRDQAIPQHFGDVPFPRRRLAWPLPEDTDGPRASISAIQF